METKVKKGDVVIFDSDSSLAFPPLYMVSGVNNGKIRLRRAKEIIVAHRTEISKVTLSIID